MARIVVARTVVARIVVARIVVTRIAVGAQVWIPFWGPIFRIRLGPHIWTRTPIWPLELIRT
jgi:hypothetical protein